MKNGKFSLGISVCAAAFIGAASALATEPRAIRVGSVLDLVPTLDGNVAHTDNMFLSETAERSSNLTQLTPRVTARITDGLHLFESMLEIFSGNYSATDEDDYTDWKLTALADVEINVRNKLRLEALHFATHEFRGTGFSQGGVFTPVPDEFDESTFDARYQFGADSARGRIVVEAGRYEKAYTNNELATFLRDRVDRSMSGTFHLGVLPSTDILLQYRNREVNYLNDPDPLVGTTDVLDSDEQYAYVGATWEATAKTSGALKLGYGTKNFADPDREDTAGPSWEATLRWEPRSYSVVNLTAGRAFGEPSGVGSGIDSSTYGVDWQHQWSGRLKSTLAASQVNDDYIDAFRTDRTRRVSARVDYSVDSWLDLFATAERDERQSELQGFSYEQNVFRLGFSASL